MEDFLFIHKLNAADDLAVIQQQDIIEILVLWKFHQKIFQSALFTKFHYHKETSAMDFVVNILNDVGMVKDFENINFLVVGSLTKRLLNGDGL